AELDRARALAVPDAVADDLGYQQAQVLELTFVQAPRKPVERVTRHRDRVGHRFKGEREVGPAGTGAVPRAGCNGIEPWATRSRAGPIHRGSRPSPSLAFLPGHRIPSRRARSPGRTSRRSYPPFPRGREPKHPAFPNV